MMRALLLTAAAGIALAADPIAGEAVYKKQCASCHEATTTRAPHRDALKTMSTARIIRTLDFGLMMTVAYPLNREQRQNVAEYLGTPGDDAPPPPEAFCATRSVNVASKPKSQWNGWSPAPGNTRFQTADGAQLTIDQVRRLKLKWAYGFEGDVNSLAAPAVFGKYVFVGSARGSVQALSVDTGCIYWTFQANGPVRNAVVTPFGRKHALLFGDQNGLFYALDTESGKVLWKKQVESHEATKLTGSPVVHNDVVYIPVASWEEARAVNPEYPCCTFRGSVVALRVKDGSQVWKTYTIADAPKEVGKNRGGSPMWAPSGAGTWSAPTIDAKRGILYVTTGNNYTQPVTETSDAVLALKLSNGQMIWSKQVTPNDAFTGGCGGGCGPDFDFGSSALLENAGGHDILLAGQKSGIVSALDPDRKGEILWQVRVGKGSANGGVQFGMASDGQNVYAAVSDHARKRNSDPTDPRMVMDPTAGGGLTALRIRDGEKTWYAPPAVCGSKPGCSPAQPGAVSAMPGVVFSGSVDGHIRAFSAEDGRVLWDFDTAQEFKTANRVRANGGALDGAGAVIAGGIVFVNSGYARNGGMPGNVLLAFAPE